MIEKTLALRGQNMFNLLKKYFFRCGHTHTPVSPVLGRLKLKDQELKVNLGCVGRHYLIGFNLYQGMCLPLVGFW